MNYKCKCGSEEFLATQTSQVVINIVDGCWETIKTTFGPEFDENHPVCRECGELLDNGE